MTFGNPATCRHVRGGRRPHVDNAGHVGNLAHACQLASLQRAGPCAMHACASSRDGHSMTARNIKQACLQEVQELKRLHLKSESTVYEEKNQVCHLQTRTRRAFIEDGAWQCARRVPASSPQQPPPPPPPLSPFLLANAVDACIPHPRQTSSLPYLGCVHHACHVIRALHECDAALLAGHDRHGSTDATCNNTPTHVAGWVCAWGKGGGGSNAMRTMSASQRWLAHDPRSST